MELAGSLARADLYLAVVSGHGFTVVLNQKADLIPLHQGSFAHTE